jgi:hypothetical protein
MQLAQSAVQPQRFRSSPRAKDLYIAAIASEQDEIVTKVNQLNSAVFPVNTALFVYNETALPKAEKCLICCTL